MKRLCKPLSALLLTLPLFLQAASPSRLEKEPTNPAFRLYRQQQRELANGERLYGPDSGRYGHVPSPVNPLPGDAAFSAAFYPAEGLPSSYDLRQLNRVTSVKNQSSCGACWSFAALGSIESSLMPGEERAFSPEHLILNHGFDYTECEGGQPWMSLAYLSRWGGPINESDFSYKQGNSSSKSYSELIEKHVQEVVFLPERASYTDNNLIKKYIMERGAVLISYRAEDEYLNTSNAAYYCNREMDTNHEVVVVGWDDNYAAGNFRITPPGKGAFIVKNSWGATWGRQGYFYMSYYDKTLTNFVSFYNARRIDDYGTNYYHDPLGWCTAYGYGSTKAWGANVFEAVNSQPIQAVSVILCDINSQCQIRVYRNATRRNPTAGQLVCQQSFSRSMPGYYTVKLDKAVAVSPGQLFSVVVSYQNGGSDKYPVAVEYPYDGYSSQVSSESGESFVSNDGQNWEDLVSEQANVCIKAFSQTVNPGMSVSVEKKRIDAWMISRSVAVISVSFSNAQASELAKFIIFRKEKDAEDYALWREVPLSEMSNGTFQCTDAYLDEYNQYSYKVVAIDANGTVLANSGDHSLQ